MVARAAALRININTDASRSQPRNGGDLPAIFAPLTSSLPLVPPISTSQRLSAGSGHEHHRFHAFPFLRTSPRDGRGRRREYRIGRDRGKANSLARASPCRAGFVSSKRGSQSTLDLRVYRGRRSACQLRMKTARSLDTRTHARARIDTHLNVLFGGTGARVFGIPVCAKYLV